MQVDAASNTYSQSSTTSSTASTQSASTLDQNAFLQLFVAQLQNQDPSSPMDTSAMLNQIAQISLVEQLSNISSDITQLKLSQEIGEASALLGKQVTVQTSDGAVSGQVEKVALSDEKVQIFIAGTGYSLDQVTEFDLG